MSGRSCLGFISGAAVALVAAAAPLEETTLPKATTTAASRCGCGLMGRMPSSTAWVAGVTQAVAKAHAIAAQIWIDYKQGVFDRSLMAYQPSSTARRCGCWRH